jgi:hypothetical protein
VRQIAFVLLLALSSAQAFEISRIPTPQDVERIRQIGWAAAADELEAGLAAAYQPSNFAQVGSTQSDIFRRWQLLAQWCRLLGTPEPEVLRTYLGRRVLEDPERERSLLVIPPGVPLPSDRSGRPLPTAADKLEGARLPANILQALLPDDYTPQEGEVALRARADLLFQLAGDTEFLREFFKNLTPDDFPPVVLTRLEQLRTAHPGRWPQYRSLMLAFALVYDQRQPEKWPHHQVDSSLVLPMDESLPDRFAYYARANDAGKLEHDLRRLSVAELKFVVDAPVPRSELDWAAKNVRLRRSQFDRAFSLVDYDERRAQRGIYQWPRENGRYVLANLELWGGICVDQAYFASLAGKAKGIPTLFFAGQGSDGGHAWFGYLRSPDGKWELDAGRYLNQNYAAGRALDPQTWLPISDHELLYLSGKALRSPHHDAALGDLAMAELFARQGLTGRRLEATQSALHNAPTFADAWDAREQALETAGDRPALRGLYVAAIEKFKYIDDLKVRYQARLADFEMHSGDTRSAAKLEEQMVSQNRRERSDLSTAAGAETLARLTEAGDYREALREFNSLARKLARRGGGNFFYGIVRPLVEELRAAGREDDAREVLKEARKRMSPETGSILDREFAKLSSPGDAQ